MVYPYLVKMDGLVENVSQPRNEKETVEVVNVQNEVVSKI